eukprot:gnl/TRDRNA2_/TRDRNA2_186871_c0_seq1.p1 gnl/TRDRNA2_/TRDRNA2_186871_c0~~gnl/TRDRNA2_/TRDRNA2_186871_c0_seq1.p1  ORF type:complete len:439 (+),score=96.16 gnl/TRDRNA2_/TRDRNA2_186871_c0_seq1:79-1395(+)
MWWPHNPEFRGHADIPSKPVPWGGCGPQPRSMADIEAARTTASSGGTAGSASSHGASGTLANAGAEAARPRGAMTRAFSEPAPQPAASSSAGIQDMDEAEAFRVVQDTLSNLRRQSYLGQDIFKETMRNPMADMRLYELKVLHNSIARKKFEKLKREAQPKASAKTTMRRSKRGSLKDWHELTHLEQVNTLASVVKTDTLKTLTTLLAPEEVEDAMGNKMKPDEHIWVIVRRALEAHMSEIMYASPDPPSDFEVDDVCKAFVSIIEFLYDTCGSLKSVFKTMDHYDRGRIVLKDWEDFLNKHGFKGCSNSMRTKVFHYMDRNADNELTVDDIMIFQQHTLLLEKEKKSRVRADQSEAIILSSDPADRHAQIHRQRRGGLLKDLTSSKQRDLPITFSEMNKRKAEQGKPLQDVVSSFKNIMANVKATGAPGNDDDDTAQ